MLRINDLGKDLARGRKVLVYGVMKEDYNILLILSAEPKLAMVYESVCAPDGELLLPCGIYQRYSTKQESCWGIN